MQVLDSANCFLTPHKENRPGLMAGAVSRHRSAAVGTHPWQLRAITRV
jgi:hypothetical protein